VADDELREQEIDTKKPGTGLPEKKSLMISGIVFVMLIIAVIAVVVFLQAPVDKGITRSPVIKNFTPPEKELSLVQTQKIQKTIPQTGTQTIRQTPPQPTQQKTPALPVDFILQPGVPSGCGLTCRQLDASITNTGYETAHNVCITVDLHNSRNEIINLNGQPSINRCIGDIAGGQKKTESITINADCGAFATRCIGETLTLQTRITSVEKTVRFPDQVIAV
jgi:hypothetical protein